MSLGKDSIQKRVAKPTQADPAKAATAAVAKKASTTRSTPKQSAAKAAPVKTAVVSKIAPEVVEKVTGHSEKAAVEKVTLGAELPYYLL